MSTYAIGDIQGCYREFQNLLDSINFDQTNDRLWITGDIVNRGPESLAALQLAKKLSAITVLGNHEFHLLAIAEGLARHGKKDTMLPVLEADDREVLLNWIRRFPLVHHDEELGFTMVHAGMHPAWDIGQAQELSSEVEQVLQSESYRDLLKNLYGNVPDQWQENLTGWERLRCIINYCTRLRFLMSSGKMDFRDKGRPGSQSDGLHPWYRVANRKTSKNRLLFGHWASLHDGDPGKFQKYNVYPLDTGCVWGRKLTAIRLEDKQFFQVPSLQKATSN